MQSSIDSRCIDNYISHHSIKVYLCIYQFKQEFFQIFCNLEHFMRMIETYCHSWQLLANTKYFMRCYIFQLYFLFVCSFVFLDRVSPYSSSGWIGTHAGNQAGLELTEICLCLQRTGFKGMCHHLLDYSSSF